MDMMIIKLLKKLPQLLEPKMPQKKRGLTLSVLLLLTLQQNLFAADQPLDRIAAVVNSDVVMLSEVRSVATRLKNRQSSQDIEQKNNQQIIKDALDQLIMLRLQIQQAKQIGIKIDDASVNEAMLSIATQNKLNLEQFRVALIREGLDYKQFRENIREKLQIEILRKRQRGQRSTITEEEVDNLIKSESIRLNKDVQYNLQDILVPAPNGSSVSAFNKAHQIANRLRQNLLGKPEFLNAKVLKKYNATGKNLNWSSAKQLSPAYMRTLSLMKVGEISPLIRDPQGFHIIKLVEQTGGQRKITQQVHVRHILLPATDPQARTKILQLRQQILAGKDFAALARKNSTDKGSAIKGGDLGTAEPASFVPPFAKATSTLPINTLSQPVQTKFGWHLIQVLERSNSDQTRDALKEQAQSLIGDKKRSDKYNSWLQGLRDSAYIEYRL